MMTYREAIRKAQHELQAVGVYEQHAQLLMLELAEQSRADLYVCYDEVVPEELLKRFEEGLERLKQQEPLSYILGYQWFYGRRFDVGPQVLIPRYETEELVANVLAEVDTYFPKQDIQVADIGTGSGAIAVTLALEEPHLHVTASDISEEALTVAKHNAATLEADVTFLQGDLCQPFIDRGIKVDVLVSNPPYIPTHQELEASVKDFEPDVALFGGEDGLYCYRRIFADAIKMLRDRAFMAFEIGYDEKEAILRVADAYFSADRKEIVQDLNGKDRMLFVYHNL